MKHTISRARSLVLALRELPARGLWPFTPDPAEPGLRVSGDPPAGTPLLIEGNSRHALDRLQRALGQAGCRLLLIDTGGLDLYTAYRTGRLAVEQILAPLPAADDSTEAPALQSPEEEGVVPSPHRDARALLPYPLWHALGPEQLAAAGVHAGPAHPEELPAFLLGAPLGPDTVRPVPPLRSGCTRRQRMPASFSLSRRCRCWQWAGRRCSWAPVVCWLRWWPSCFCYLTCRRCSPNIPGGCPLPFSPVCWALCRRWRIRR